MSVNLKDTLVVLGGDDAEMTTIRTLLSHFGIRWVQPNKGWGDHIYNPEQVGLKMKEISGMTPKPTPEGKTRPQQSPEGVEHVIFVECRPGDGWCETGEMTVIDHHGDRSGEQSSILQLIWAFQNCWGWMSPSLQRWTELIAANDQGYIPALQAFGATPDEIDRIRRLDRQAQGITTAHEAEAERAIGAKEIDGRLTIVRMDHSKTATVADRLFGQHDQLLILSGDGEANFYGDGALCAELKTRFEGWCGGAGLGKAGSNAFWGGGYPKHDELLSFIKTQLSQ